MLCVDAGGAKLLAFDECGGIFFPFRKIIRVETMDRIIAVGKVAAQSCVCPRTGICEAETFWAGVGRDLGRTPP